MKKIQVLGGGCAKCGVLATEAQKAAEALGIEFEIEKVTDFAEIAKMGIMTTPALVVDGVVQFSGQVLKANQIEAYLK